jgi:hypothetical protein
MANIAHVFRLTAKSKDGDVEAPVKQASKETK